MYLGLNRSYKFKTLTLYLIAIKLCFFPGISLTLPQGFWLKNLQIFENAWQHGETK